MMDSLATEGFLRQFVDTTRDLVTVVDAEGRFVYLNRAASEFFGVRACADHLAWEFIHPEDLERTRRAFRRWLADSEPHAASFENRQIGASGDVRTFRWTVTAPPERAGAVRYLTSVAYDLTDLRDYERRLVRNQTRLEALLSGMLDAVITIDSQGIVQNASDSVSRILGYEPAELHGRNIKILMPEPHRSRHDEYLARYEKTGSTWILGTTREFEVIRKGGVVIPVELSVSRIDIPGEDRPLYCGVFRDISERRQARVALAESERRFRAIFDQEFQLVGLLTPDGLVLEMNQTALDTIGIQRSEVIGRPFWETRWWQSGGRSGARIRDAIREAAAGKFVRFETEYPGRGGQLLTIDFSLRPIRDADGRVSFLLPEGRDITLIKQAQERETGVLRALATIGESAAILAHEIKNPITAINSALRAVADQLGEDQQSVLQELVGRMERLEKTMRRALSFTRPLELNRVSLDVDRLLRRVTAMHVDDLAGSDIELTVEVEPGTPRVYADECLIEEVVTNLIKNAQDAVESGGRIALRGGHQVNGAVWISIDDSGPGIPEGVRATLFQPFVTTKEKGTGIGLALCRKILEAHSGSVEVVSAEELGGARFVLTLPVPG